MKEQDFIFDNYYLIKKKTLWTVIVVITSVILILCYEVFIDAHKPLEKEYIENHKIEFGTINSKLKNVEECYLCGDSNRSLMGYYRNFDTIGVIGLNEWYVLDLRLKAYDEQGNESDNLGTMGMSSGVTQGVRFEVNSVVSRGMSSTTVSSEEEFNSICIQNNLCQECLDKVTDTLERYCKKGEKENYNPFVLVDFKTLETYSLQNQERAFFVRDYWINLEYENEEITIQAYYLPEKW